MSESAAIGDWDYFVPRPGPHKGSGDAGDVKRVAEADLKSRTARSGEVYSDAEPDRAEIPAKTDSRRR